MPKHGRWVDKGRGVCQALGGSRIAHHPGCLERQPNCGFDAVDRTFVFVAAALEAKSDVTLVVEELEHSSLEVFLESQDERERELHGELAVAQRVAHIGERGTPA